jgi:hypothetical protein
MFLVSRFSASDLCWETSANLKIQFRSMNCAHHPACEKTPTERRRSLGTFEDRNRIRARPPSGGPVARNVLFLTKDHEQR